ncbi:hypothetical protein BDV96DRAFT_598123 [Lophiotrema nucula]|uniref:Uncharacterized protein n=1 Tax=Lophiotrema nucula TaxID=690887 RepID=A0A6A5ZEP0_9PLEO|nr:hypothetical protein BDV96DRAFT_598123 [Lophiotrema nucula]
MGYYDWDDPANRNFAENGPGRGRFLVEEYIDTLEVKNSVTQKTTDDSNNDPQQNKRRAKVTKEPKEKDDNSSSINISYKARGKSSSANGSVQVINTLGSTNTAGGMPALESRGATQIRASQTTNSPETSNKRKRDKVSGNDGGLTGDAADGATEVYKRVRTHENGVGGPVERDTRSQDSLRVTEQAGRTATESSDHAEPISLDLKSILEHLDRVKPTSLDLTMILKLLDRAELPPGYHITQKPPKHLDVAGGLFEPTVRLRLYVDSKMCEPPKKLDARDFPEGGVFIARTSRPTWDSNAKLGENFLPGAGGLICEIPHWYWTIHNDDMCMITLCITTHGGKGGVDKHGNMLPGHIKFEDMIDESSGHSKKDHPTEKDRVIRMVSRVKGAPKISDNAFVNCVRPDARDHFEDTLPVGMTSLRDTALARTTLFDHILDNYIRTSENDVKNFLRRGEKGWANVEEAKKRAAADKAKKLAASDANTGLTNALVQAELGSSVAIPPFTFAPIHTKNIEQKPSAALEPTMDDSRNAVICPGPNWEDII